jgi:phosphate transport system protein
MLSNYVKQREEIKNELKAIFANLLHAHEILNVSIKECDTAKFQEAKTYTMNMSNKINDIENYIIKFLALYSPEARELRRFVAYLKITGELLRMNSNTKSFINGCIDIKEIVDTSIVNDYLLPLHTSTLSALAKTKEMIDIDEEDELQDIFNKIIVEEHKTDDLYDLIEEQVFALDLEYKTINQMLKTFRKIEKIADRTIEIANLLLYYKIGGRLQNV